MKWELKEDKKYYRTDGSSFWGTPAIPWEHRSWRQKLMFWKRFYTDYDPCRRSQYCYTGTLGLSENEK